MWVAVTLCAEIFDEVRSGKRFAVRSEAGGRAGVSSLPDRSACARAPVTCRNTMR